jgi:hypothetical protein
LRSESDTITEVGRNLMILLLDEVSREELQAAIDDGAGFPSVYLVAPAQVGPLEWLATDERRARSEAEARVLEAEWLLAGSAAVGGRSGSPDPVQAVEDALDSFPADEVVVVGHGTLDEELLTGLRRFGVPVTWRGLALQEPSFRSRMRETMRSLSSGRSEGTPWVAFVAANLGLLLIGVVIAVIASLIVWLIRAL